MIGASPYTSGGYTPIKLEPHLHTVHSDGQDTIAAMFAACKSAGYEAVALTDHNTSSGMAEAAAVAADLGLVFIPGVEVTTFRGHAVVLGVERVPEWRDLERRGMDALAAEVHAQGGVLSVAHATALGSPVCSGCAWEWPIEPEAIDYWEILRARGLSTDAPLELWRQLLERGGRIAPCGAGDVHFVAAAAAERAATYVFVRERTRDGVLEGLRAHRTCASEAAPLEFWLENRDGRTAVAGERVVGGDAWTPRCDPRAEVQSVQSRDATCVYAELRDPQGRLEAIAAPIWISTSH